MNEVIKVLKTNGAIAIIIQTEGDDDFWVWEVDESDFVESGLTIEEFANSEDYSGCGASSSGYDTVDEAIADIGEGWEEMDA